VQEIRVLTELFAPPRRGAEQIQPRLSVVMVKEKVAEAKKRGEEKVGKR
jgi:hypothetical protein